MTDSVNTEAGHEGAILGIRADRIVGWAWDRARPYDAIDVDLHIGTLRVGTARAGAFDEELALRRKGNGFHAFAAALSLLPDGDGPFRLDLYAAGTAERIGAPLTIADRRELERLLASRNLAGRIDGIEDGAVRGWVADFNAPESKPPLVVAFDETPLLHTLTPSRGIEHEGRIVSGWIFKAALPHGVLDGRIHAVTAQVGNFILTGTPLAIGPTEANGAMQAITALTRSMATLSRQVAVLPSAHNTDGLIEILSDRILDRVDMLMAIYRDDIEQELDLMRAQVLALSAKVSGSNEDPILPVLIARPSARAFSPPKSTTIDVVLDEDLPVVHGTFKRITDPSGPAQTVIWEALEFALPAGIRRNQTLVVRGAGATSARRLLAWQFHVSDEAILGRFEIGADGTWIFVGQFAQPAGERQPLERMTVFPGLAYVEDEVLPESLTITHLSFVDRHVSTASSEDLPVAAAYHVAGAIDGRGWHRPESGTEAWFRWGGEAPGIQSHLRPGLARRIIVIGENHVPGEPRETAIRVNDATLPSTFRFTEKAFQRWILEADAPAATSARTWTDLVLPHDFAKSPAAFEGSGDRRVLSISVRAIALDPLPGARGAVGTGDR